MTSRRSTLQTPPIGDAGSVLYVGQRAIVHVSAAGAHRKSGDQDNLTHVLSPFRSPVRRNWLRPRTRAPSSAGQILSCSYFGKALPEDWLADRAGAPVQEAAGVVLPFQEFTCSP